MKVVLRGSSLPLTLIGILSHAGISKVETTLRRGVVGPLKIGMDLEAVRAEFGESAVETAGSGEVSIYLGSDRRRQPDLIAEFSRNSLFEIKVNTRKYRTALGIGVGSATGDLKRLYDVLWQTPEVAYVDSLDMGFDVQDGKIASILVS